MPVGGIRLSRVPPRYQPTRGLASPGCSPRRHPRSSAANLPQVPAERRLGVRRRLAPGPASRHAGVPLLGGGGGPGPERQARRAAMVARRARQVRRGGIDRIGPPPFQ